MAIKLFNKQMELFQKTLDLRSRKNSMIASNLANRETPGYRAQDLVFENELSKAYHSDRPGPLKVSDARHFDGAQREPLETVEGTQINSFNPDPRMDGNTVDLDKEMTKLAENQLMYQISVRFISRKFNSLKNAIMEGGK